MQASFIKKPLLFLTILSLSSSCKKDEASIPEISSINTDNTKIAIGQYILLKPKLEGDETDLSRLNYGWSCTDGFTSTEPVAKWTPKKTGENIITLIVSGGKKSNSKSASFNVVIPDFRLGLWGNTREDILLYESKSGKKPISLSPAIIFQGENESTFDGYVLTNNRLATAATFLPRDIQAAITINILPISTHN